MSDDTTLTDKQRQFVQEYLVDLNATQAVYRAGYDCANDNSAAATGSELLRHPKVRALVESYLNERAERTQISADRVLRELACIAFAKATTYAEWNESGIELRDSLSLSEDDKAAVLSVSEVMNQHGGSRSVKLHDKVKALELLSRHLGLFNDKLELEVTDPLASRLEAARLRARQASGPNLDTADGDRE